MLLALLLGSSLHTVQSSGKTGNGAPFLVLSVKTARAPRLELDDVPVSFSGWPHPEATQSYESWNGKYR